MAECYTVVEKKYLRVLMFYFVLMAGVTRLSHVVTLDLCSYRGQMYLESLIPCNAIELQPCLPMIVVKESVSLSELFLI